MAVLDEFAPTGSEGVYVPEPELPRPKTPEEAGKLDPGTAFIDPAGKRRTVPYRPATLEDVADIPEGAQFVDPSGTLREKPRDEGVGFTAQMLYDMALTPEAKKEVMEKFSPGQIKEAPDGLYVDDNGTFRRPGAERGLGETAGYLASQAAPLGGMVAGGVMGTEL